MKNEGVGIKRKHLSDVYEYGNLDLNAQGIAKANQLMARDSAIYANMQNKINNEVLTSRGITANSVDLLELLVGNFIGVEQVLMTPVVFNGVHEFKPVILMNLNIVLMAKVS